MIRFVDMTDALELDGERAFAWFDTVTDTFMEFVGEEIWHSWASFAVDWEEDRLSRANPKSEIERFRRLFPKEWYL